MENCLGKLKNRWPDARIGLSGLTYAPREEAKNTLIVKLTVSTKVFVRSWT